MSHRLFYRCPYYVSGPGNITVVLLSMEGQRFHKKMYLFSEDERRRFEWHEGEWVIYDIIFILGWTN